MKFEKSELFSYWYDGLLMLRWTCQEKLRIGHIIILTPDSCFFRLLCTAACSAHMEMSPGLFLLFFNIQYRVMSHFIIIFHLSSLKFYQTSTFPTQSTCILLTRTLDVTSNVRWFKLSVFRKKNGIWQSKRKRSKWYAWLLVFSWSSPHLNKKPEYLNKHFQIFFKSLQAGIQEDTFGSKNIIAKQAIICAIHVSRLPKMFWKDFPKLLCNCKVLLPVIARK